MLAQSFVSAAELGITEPQRAALQKVLVLLETGKLVHVAEDELRSNSYAFDYRPEKFSGHFNMGWTSINHVCGTVACIMGTAELISGVDFCNAVNRNSALYELFYTKFMNDRDITPTQAARALRSYLTSGDAKWAEAVA